jgi:hypothetical protein
MFSKIALLLLAALPLAAQPKLPLSDGETFIYKVAWAVLPGAGEIKITAQTDTTAAAPRLRVVTTTVTRGLAKILLPFEARAESLFDFKSAKLLSLSEYNQQRSKRSEHTVTFDYTGAQALYGVPGSTDKPRALPLPPGEPLDLITCLIQTRAWNIKPGEARDVLVLFDDDFYELTIRAVRIEEVRTPLGTFQALVLEPRMEKTPLKGMFKKGSTVRVWISQDERHLPIRFEVEFKIGTGTATLIRYEPPAPAKLATDQAPSPDEKKDPRP